jgi:hypothetical protein
MHRQDDIAIVDEALGALWPHLPRADCFLRILVNEMVANNFR